MSVLYVSRAYLEIDGATIECTDLDRNSENGLDKVKTMNRANRAKGYTDGIPDHGFSATVPIPREGLPVDLEEIFESKKEFGAVIELEGGKKKLYTECRISTLSSKFADGEKGEFSIEVMALGMTPS